MRSRAVYQYLFSYGTLQIESVQREVVGRVLTGFADGLPFFDQSLLEVLDGGSASTGRNVRYLMARYSGRHTDVVEGTAFPVTPSELRRTDKYEGAAYKRVASVLRSGVCAWVYVDIRSSTVGTVMAPTHRTAAGEQGNVSQWQQTPTGQIRFSSHRRPPG